ncbi:T9SS type A sorting domain-containing protein [Mangrovibacterium diazotrophicum]|uniref:Putative repeat protein (TIGR02543 family)/predicted secreted protein (Por secretion system target) n=1 Tax=Mangrovibacterium diazotrophicum TaxID=1261403 RepID=A0A419W4P3_9BACT|nr:T9SS type A sorting domain-containing protein [Mangrovibacterium diazotrophicum]RKD90423.1 putative repeat protein (TIGR02543 family)/predicted secreted protein (Por secretion system target) [Mangrovibacterium diazotrophicum]
MKNLSQSPNFPPLFRNAFVLSVLFCCSMSSYAQEAADTTSVISNQEWLHVDSITPDQIEPAVLPDYSEFAPRLKSTSIAVQFGQDIESGVAYEDQNIYLTYSFEQYESSLHIQFQADFTNEDPTNRITFYFDKNRNGIEDYKYDPRYSGFKTTNGAYIFCPWYRIDETYITTCGGLDSDGWMGFDGDLKTLTFNVPVSEVTDDGVIAFYIYTTYGCAPACNNEQNLSLSVPELINTSDFLETLDAKGVTENTANIGFSCLLDNDAYVEKGIIWSDEPSLSIKKNLGYIKDSSTNLTFYAEVKDLEDGKEYYYCPTVVLDNFRVYGETKSFITEVDSTKYIYATDDIVIPRSGKFVISLVADSTYQKWGQPTWEILKGLTQPVFERIDGDYDFVFVVMNSYPENAAAVGLSYGISNDVSNIGRRIFDLSSYYGLPSGTKSVIWLSDKSNVPYGPSLHEISHTWGNFLFHTKAIQQNSLLPEGVEEIDYRPHWGVASAGGQLGGFAEFVTDVDGVENKYQAYMKGTPGFGQNVNGGNSVPYSNIELYLMGMISLAEVNPLSCFYKLSVDSYSDFRSNGIFYSDSVVVFDQETILDTFGERFPKSSDAQKDFEVLFVLLANRMPTNEEQEELEAGIDYLTFKGEDDISSLYNFFEATGGRGTLSAPVLTDSVKPFKINYELAGGINDPQNPDTFYYTTPDISLYDPVMDCNTFQGWYTDAEFTQPLQTIKYHTEEDVSLWAKWESNSSTSNENVAICDGEEYQGWTATGVYQRSLINSLGCDSVVTTNLEVLSGYNIEQTVSICEGDAFKNWTISGEYIQHLESMSGCDSTVTTFLTVQPAHKSEEIVTICNGSSYLDWTETGTYERTLASTVGCDSLVTTNLTVLDGYSEEQYVTICEGENYLGWNESGTYDQALTASNGCDSTITTYLQVNKLIEPEIETDGDTLFCNTSYHAYQWYSQDGIVQDAFTSEYVISQSGTYYLVVTDEDGCTSSSELIAMIKTAINELPSTNNDFLIYPNPSSGKIYIRLNQDSPSGALLKVVDETGVTHILSNLGSIGNENTWEIDVSHLPKGNYFVTIMTKTDIFTQKMVLQ